MTIDGEHDDNDDDKTMTMPMTMTMTTTMTMAVTTMTMTTLAMTSASASSFFFWRGVYLSVFQAGLATLLLFLQVWQHCFQSDSVSVWPDPRFALRLAAAGLARKTSFATMVGQSAA